MNCGTIAYAIYYGKKDLLERVLENASLIEYGSDYEYY